MGPINAQHQLGLVHELWPGAGVRAHGGRCVHLRGLGFQYLFVAPTGARGWSSKPARVAWMPWTGQRCWSACTRGEAHGAHTHTYAVRGMCTR